MRYACALGNGTFYLNLRTSVKNYNGTGSIMIFIMKIICLKTTNESQISNFEILEVIPVAWALFLS